MSFIGETEVKESLVGNINMLKVINGYSAYELALKCGFKGTLEEWLESLKVKGDPGTMELSGELDAKGKRIMNVADPEADGDAVNLKCVKDKISFISKPVEAVLSETIDAGDLGTITYFEIEAEWLDYDSLPNGFELTIIPNAPNGNFTCLSINGGKLVSVNPMTGNNIPHHTFQAGFPHKLLYFCNGTYENGNKIDSWLSLSTASQVLGYLSLGEALPIESGGTGATKVDDVQENLGVYGTRIADSKFMKIFEDIDCRTMKLDEVTAEGFYSGQGVTGSPFEEAFIEVRRGINGFVRQEAHDASSGTLAVRYKGSSDAGWSEWEYENPPMELRKMYKTTQRWLGKPVYTYMLEIEWQSNETIETLFRDTVCVFNYYGTVDDKVALTGIDTTLNNNNYCGVCIYGDENIGSLMVSMRGGANYNGKTAYIQIWFVK